MPYDGLITITLVIQWKGSQNECNKVEKTFSRRHCLPLALQSLDLRATAKPKPVTPPKRIIFICSCLGFYKPYFFPKKGDLATSDYLKDMKTLDKMTVFNNLYHPGMDTSNHDSEKSFLTGSLSRNHPHLRERYFTGSGICPRNGQGNSIPLFEFH